MKRKLQKKLVHEGNYVAEVEVDLILTEDGWSPCLSVEDAGRLDEVRKLLKDSKLKEAGRLARVFSLTPVTG